MIGLLPLGGLLIVWLYRISHDQNDKGTNMVLASLRAETELPVQMAPLIFVSTVVTHFCGGSAGRDGAALQLGGSVGSRIEQKYLVPITANPALELLALDPADPDQAALLEKLRDSFALDENEFGYELRLRAALGEIWLGLLALPRPEARPGAAAFDEKCKAMLAFVHEHYAEPLRIEQIAAAGFCSQREAFRTFQQCLHVTPLNYLQSYRLQMAADRLVRSGQQITAIAVDCGFASLSYFGKVFRQKFGCTPAQFRSKWQDITNTGR